jgi:hypothetical protein
MSTNPPEHESSLVNNPRKVPDADKLVEQVRGDILDGHTTGFFSGLLRKRRTRSCWWPGKIKTGANNDGTKDNQDGLVPGTRMALPYAGALDHEVRVVDGRCNREVDMALLVWYRSEKIVRPRDAMDDDQAKRVKAWADTVHFYLDVSKEDLVDSLELFANTMSESGKAVWYEGWEKRWRMGRKTMKWDDVVVAKLREMMAATGRADMESGLQPVTDPNEWQQIHGPQFDAQMAMLRMDKESLGDLMVAIQGINPIMSDKEAKKVAQAFQNNEEKADYFCPVEQTPMPVHEVYVPGVNCFYPVMSGTKQKRVPRMAFLEMMTEAQIRIASKQDGWDAEFTKEVLEKHRGEIFDFTGWGGGGTWSSSDLNGFDAGLQTDAQALRHAGLYVMVWLWTWGVDDNGLAAPYRTLVHPNISEMVGLHECDPMGTGKMPWFLATRTKKRLLANASEGVPDEMLTNQLGRKKLEDAMTAQTEMRANPPRLDLGDSSADGLRPGCVIGVAQKFLSNGGGPRFMDVPDISPGSMGMLEWLKGEENDYYVTGEEADPDAKRARMVRVVGGLCGVFECIIHMMCLHIQRGVDRLKVSSVNGEAVNYDIRGEDLDGELDVVVRCDEGSIDPDLAEKKMKAFMTFAAQADRTGAAPWDMIFKRFAWMIDPAIGQGVIPTNVAAGRIRADEAQRISQMVTGKTFEYDQMADAPTERQKELDMWLADPVNVQFVQTNEVLMEKIERERQWILFAIEQQQVNPTTGRTGVPPDKRMAEMGMQQPA